MILLISENADVSTNHVIEWITSFGYPFVRINWEDEVKILRLDLNSFTLLVNNEVQVEYDQITSVWFRRGQLRLNLRNLKPDDDKDRFAGYLRKHLKVEQEAYVEYIFHLLLKKRHIGAFDKLHINKFLILDKAIECGFKVPETQVVTSKQDLIGMISKHEKIITKSSNHILNFEYDSENYMTYTEVVNSMNLQDIPETFAPSLCQTMIEKVYDVRVFYLDGECYSMTILSQKRAASKVDFRKYDYANPNRRVPFQLRADIEEKIKTFMKMMDLESGSIDLVIDESGAYYFLEVNPVGQYGMVEFPCNYMLNKKIAQYLINE